MTPRPGVMATPLAVHGGRNALAGDRRSPIYDFSVCLNAFGPAEVVRRAIQGTSIDEYPDPYCRAPRQAAAKRWHRDIEEIAFGAGAAEFIHAVCFAYLRSNDAVLIATPAFGEYERATRLCGGIPYLFPYGDPGNIEGERRPLPDSLCDAITRTRPRLVFFCTPANPTGYGTPRSDLIRIANTCEEVGTLLVLDQAYDLFSTHPLGFPALAGNPVVLHLRSLTKDHALAGVRVAFAIGPVDVIQALDRVRIPWSVSAAAQAAGVAALTDQATQHAQESIAILQREAKRLAYACQQLGIPTHPSETHFFLAHVGEARKTCEQLKIHTGIYVRDCTSFGLPAWIRIAARTPSENTILLKALRTFPLIGT